jgi:hypothetical protein
VGTTAAHTARVCVCGKPVRLSLPPSSCLPSSALLLPRPRSYCCTGRGLGRPTSPLLPAPRLRTYIRVNRPVHVHFHLSLSPQPPPALRPPPTPELPPPAPAPTPALARAPFRCHHRCAQHSGRSDLRCLSLRPRSRPSAPVRCPLLLRPSPPISPHSFHSTPAHCAGGGHGAWRPRREVLAPPAHLAKSKDGGGELVSPTCLPPAPAPLPQAPSRGAEGCSTPCPSVAVSRTRAPVPFALLRPSPPRAHPRTHSCRGLLLIPTSNIHWFI